MSNSPNLNIDQHSLTLTLVLRISSITHTMPSQIRPIKVYGAGGPNLPKLSMVLEELDRPYEQIPMTVTELREPPFLAINPNGRIPAIYDPEHGTHFMGVRRHSVLPC